MSKDTILIEMTADDLEYIIDSFWNNYGSGRPDPRRCSSEELKNYFRDEEDIEESKEEWDERYKTHRKWVLRYRRLMNKIKSCFGSEHTPSESCDACPLHKRCEEVQAIANGKRRW